jgi:hypothetical protein
MSDETEPLGAAATAAAQSYPPMPEPTSDEPARTYENDEGLRQAARDLGDARAAASTEPPDDKLYFKAQPQDERPQYSISPEKAAASVSDYHANNEKQNVDAHLQELQREVDLARAAYNGDLSPTEAAAKWREAKGQPEIPPVQPDAPQPQAEVADQPVNGVDPDLAKLLETKPHVREQLEAPLRQAAQVQATYAAATREMAAMAGASILASFNELNGLTAEQLPVAMQVIEKQNPQRALEIKAHLAHANQIYAAAMQASQAQQAQQAQIVDAQWKQFTQSEDAAFDAAMSKRGVAKSEIKAAGEEIINAAAEHGISKEGLWQLYQTQPILRSAAFQELLLDAAKYRLAQRTARAEPARTLPPVQRPGVATSVDERAHADIGSLRERFKSASGRDQLKLGVELLKAQRARG